jgi:hypothetical protein
MTGQSNAAPCGAPPRPRAPGPGRWTGVQALAVGQPAFRVWILVCIQLGLSPSPKLEHDGAMKITLLAFRTATRSKGRACWRPARFLFTTSQHKASPPNTCSAGWRTAAGRRCSTVAAPRRKLSAEEQASAKTPPAPGADAAAPSSSSARWWSGRWPRSADHGGIGRARAGPNTPAQCKTSETAQFLTYLYRKLPVDTLHR